MKQTQPNTTANKHGMLYDLEDKVPAVQSVIYGIQYLVYFLAGSAIMPVIIGAYLGLDQAEIAQMLQRTFLLSGGVSILQAILGHRYPIIDGPAGLWMGLLIILAETCTSFGQDLAVLRTNMEVGMIIAGIMVIIVALTGLVDKILKVFTPIVNGTFLILMVMQMSATVIKGATGISSGYKTIQPKFLAVFLITTAVILVINLKAKGFLQSIATLIGVVCGWILAYALGISPDFISSGNGFLAIPQPFAWGTPTIYPSVIITCLIGEFMLFCKLCNQSEWYVRIAGSRKYSKTGEKKYGSLWLYRYTLWCISGYRIRTICFRTKYYQTDTSCCKRTFHHRWTLYDASWCDCSNLYLLCGNSSGSWIFCHDDRICHDAATGYSGI